MGAKRRALVHVWEGFGLHQWFHVSQSEPCGEYWARLGEVASKLDEPRADQGAGGSEPAMDTRDGS